MDLITLILIFILLLSIFILPADFLRRLNNRTFDKHKKGKCEIEVIDIERINRSYTDYI
jgi:hypothetical protein